MDRKMTVDEYLDKIVLNNTTLQDSLAGDANKKKKLTADEYLDQVIMGKPPQVINPAPLPNAEYNDLSLNGTDSIANSSMGLLPSGSVLTDNQKKYWDEIYGANFEPQLPPISNETLASNEDENKPHVLKKDNKPVPIDRDHGNARNLSFDGETPDPLHIGKAAQNSYWNLLAMKGASGRSDAILRNNDLQNIISGKTTPQDITKSRNFTNSEKALLFQAHSYKQAGDIESANKIYDRFHQEALGMMGDAAEQMQKGREGYIKYPKPDAAWAEKLNEILESSGMTAESMLYSAPAYVAGGPLLGRLMQVLLSSREANYEKGQTSETLLKNAEKSDIPLDVNEYAEKVRQTRDWNTAFLTLTNLLGSTLLFDPPKGLLEAAAKIVPGTGIVSNLAKTAVKKITPVVAGSLPEYIEGSGQELIQQDSTGRPLNFKEAHEAGKGELVAALLYSALGKTGAGLAKTAIGDYQNAQQNRQDAKFDIGELAELGADNLTSEELRNLIKNIESTTGIKVNLADNFDDGGDTGNGPTEIVAEPTKVPASQEIKGILTQLKAINPEAAEVAEAQLAEIDALPEDLRAEAVGTIYEQVSSILNEAENPSPAPVAKPVRSTKNKGINSEGIWQSVLESYNSGQITQEQLIEAQRILESQGIQAPIKDFSTTETVKEMADQLNNSQSPEDAIAILRKTKKESLSRIATEMGVEVAPEDTPASLRRKIIEASGKSSIGGENVASDIIDGEGQDTVEPTPQATPQVTPQVTPEVTGVAQEAEGVAQEKGSSQKTGNNTTESASQGISTAITQESAEDALSGLNWKQVQKIGKDYGVLLSRGQTLGEAKTAVASAAVAKNQSVQPVAQNTQTETNQETPGTVPGVQSTPATGQSNETNKDSVESGNIKAYAERTVERLKGAKSDAERFAILLKSGKNRLKAIGEVLGVKVGNSTSLDSDRSNIADAVAGRSPSDSSITLSVNTVSSERTESDAMEYLNEQKGDHIRVLADRLGVPYKKSDTLAKIKKDIVSKVFGARKNESRRFVDNATDSQKTPTTKYRVSDAFEVDEAGKDRTSEFDSEESGEDTTQPTTKDQQEDMGVEEEETKVRDVQEEKTEDQNLEQEDTNSEQEDTNSKQEEDDFEKQDKQEKIDLNKKVTFAGLKKAFPKESVENLGKGVFRVKFRNGNIVYVTLSSKVDVDPVAFKKERGREPTKAEIESGALGSSTKIVEGQTLIQVTADMTMTAENINQRFGIREGNKISPTTRGREMSKTIFHESFHTASDIALSSKERSLLNGKYGNEENQADAYMDWLLKRESKSPVGKIFQRIFDFFSSIKANILGANSESVFRDIAKGKVFDTGTGRASANNRGTNTHYQIGGKYSETMNKDNLDMAQLMQSWGENPKVIWDKTGWEMGPDKKWRYEIDPAEAKIAPSWNKNGKTLGQSIADRSGVVLKDVFQFPSLFEAYPLIARTKMEFRPSLSSGILAGYSPANKSIVLGPDFLTLSDKEALPVLHHEIQHGIQIVEHFAMGGNSQMMRKRAVQLQGERLKAEQDPALRNALREYNKAVNRRDKGEITDSDLQGILDDLMENTPSLAATKYFTDQLERLGLEGDAADDEYAQWAAYRRLHGEAEAKATEIRASMTPEERASQRPSETLHETLITDGLVPADSTLEDAVLVVNAGQETEIEIPWRTNNKQREESSTGVDSKYRMKDTLHLDDKTLTDNDRTMLKNIDAYRNWEPSKTKDGKILGAPEWVQTDRDVKKMRKLLRQLVEEGISARYWYEDSGREVITMVGGNAEEAAMFCQILAIFSANTMVDGNTSNAIKAWNMYKRGVPESEFHVATSAQDKKAINVLYHGDKWEGRKTGSFYTNLMFEILKDNPELAKALEIDMDKLKATIDLWMYRAFGYENEQGGDDQKYGKYTFAESSTIRLTAELNRERQPGEPIWTPHQVQACIWTSMKTRYGDETVKSLTNELSLKQGAIKMKDGKPVYPREGTPERKQHYKNWRNFALSTRDSAWVKGEAERTGVSFADYIQRMTQHITLEAIPSSNLNADINSASESVKRAFTQRVVSEIILDENGNDQIAQLLGVPTSRVSSSEGAYDGGVNPNIISSLVPDKVTEYNSKGEPTGSLIFDYDFARKYARIIQYLFKQDAVPWFCPDSVPPSKEGISNQKFKVVEDKDSKQRTVRKFDTLQEAETYLAKKGNPNYSIIGGSKAEAIRLTFSEDLTGEKLNNLLRLLETKLGGRAGFTKISAREVAIINFRDDSTKIPFLDDTVFLGSFTDIKEGLHSLGVVDVANFYSEGEYGYAHDWKADKTGSAILDSDLFAGRSDIQERASVWRDVYESLLKEYSGDNLRSIEEGINKRGRDNEISAGENSKGNSKYRVGTAETVGRSDSWWEDRRKYAGSLDYNKAKGSPASPYRRGDNKGRRWIAGIEVSVTPYNPTGEFEAHQGYSGDSAPVYLELGEKNASQVFHNAISASVKNNAHGSSVEIKDASDYKGMRLFVTEGGDAGFAISKDGDLVSVFATPGKGGKKAGSMLFLAIQEGAQTLDCFDTVLPYIYSQMGFKPIARIKWNDDYAPEGWDYELYKKYNNGRPDVVFMAYDPNYFQIYSGPEEGTLVDSYDEAIALREKVLNELKSGESDSTSKYRVSDREYLDAVEAGDMDTAQQMVNDAAKEAGYGIGPVFHGTNADFNAFDKGMVGNNYDKDVHDQAGIFFTNRAKGSHPGGTAEDWARQATEKKGGKERVLGAYLNIKNPFTMSDYSKASGDSLDSIMTYAGDRQPVVDIFDNDSQYILEKAKELGKDGIVFEDTFDGETDGLYVPFDPEQIKSADPVVHDNQGTVIPLSERFNPEKTDIRYRVRGGMAEQQLDTDYLTAVKAGDMETAQQMVDKAIKEAGIPILDDSAATAYQARRTAPPQKTIKAWKLFSTKPGQLGKVFPLFVGATDALPKGVWLDAQEGPEAVPTKTGRRKVKSKLGNLAFRPGWHAGDVPLATHIGVKDADGNITARRANEVWAEVEVAADRDYQPEADANGRTVKGQASPALADIKHMPKDGFYRYKTNPNMTGNWIISGSMKINRILTEDEVNSILKEKNLTPMPWDGGKLVLEDLGLSPEIANNIHKLSDPVTYDDAGNVIPLSQRFNPEKSDIRYRIRGGMAESENAITPELIRANMPGVKINSFDNDIASLKLWNGKHFAIDMGKKVLTGEDLYISGGVSSETDLPLNAESIPVIDGNNFISMVDGMSRDGILTDEGFEFARDMILDDQDILKLDRLYGNSETQKKLYREFLTSGEAPGGIDQNFKDMKKYFTSVRDRVFGKDSAKIVEKISQESRENNNQRDSKYRVATREEQSDQWKNLTNKYDLEEVVDPTRIGQSIQERMKSAWTWWKREMLDDISGIDDYFGKDVYIAATNAIHGINSRAEALIKFGEKKKGVKGLYEIFGQVPTNEQDGFMHYAVYKQLADIANNAEHAFASVEYLEQLAKDERKIAKDFSKRTPIDSIEKKILDHNAKLHNQIADEYDAQADIARKQIHTTRAKANEYAQVIKEMEANYPHWRGSQKDLAKYSRYLLWKLQKAGIISKNLHDVLVSRYPNYIPLQRDFGEEGGMEGFIQSRGIVNLTSPVKKLKGSRRDVKDPLFQILANTYTFEGLIGKQDAALKIAEMADNGELAGIVDPTDDRRTTPGQYIFHVWEDGKKKFYKTNKDIYTALVMSSQNNDPTGLLKILSIPVKMLRAGVTHGLGFILRNPMRDTVNAGMVGDHFIPILTTLDGMFSILSKRDGWFEEFLKSGGSQGAMYMSARNAEDLAREIRMGKGTEKFLNKLKNPPRAIWTLLGDLAEFTEMGTRVGQYKAVRKRGGDKGKAAYIARDLQNFQRGGRVSRAISKVNPFFNAQLQGVAKGMRSMFHDGKPDYGNIARGLLYVTIPSILTSLYNYDDDDRREKYLRIPTWQRNLFWNYVIGKGEDSWVLKIPKPFDLGILFGSLAERSMDYLYANDKKAFDDIGISFRDAISPETAPLFLTIPFELEANYDKFRQRNIVPMGQENLASKLQYGAYTAEWAKWAGEKLDLSPRKLEHVYMQLTGNFGKDASQASDKILRSMMDETRPSKKWYQEIPGVSSFAVPIDSMKKQEQDFRDEKEKLDSLYRSAREMRKTTPWKEMSPEDKRILGLEGLVKRISRYSTGKGGIGDIYSDINKITMMKGMSADEKREKVQKLEKRIHDMSVRGLKEIDQINDRLKK